MRSSAKSCRPRGIGATRSTTRSCRQTGRLRRGARYVDHGVFARGCEAISALLDGVAVDVTALFDEAAE